MEFKAIASIFGTISMGLIVYIWQSLIAKMNKRDEKLDEKLENIDRYLTQHLLVTSKISEDNIKINKEVELLFKKDSKRQSEIQAMDKDLAIVKHKLAI